MPVHRIDHVLIAMPAGREEEARAFYGGMLGFAEKAKPPQLAARGGCWFENGAVTVHLGVDKNFIAARKAHPAFIVDGLADLVARPDELRERSVGILGVDRETADLLVEVAAASPAGPAPITSTSTCSRVMAQAERERAFSPRQLASFHRACHVLSSLLPLPARLRERLLRALHTEGYDWLGLFMGRIADERWTCIGACLELYRRLGVATNPYGTGLLGVGTTLFDPIMPVRFLSDPAFRLLTDDSPPEHAA